MHSRDLGPALLGGVVEGEFGDALGLGPGDDLQALNHPLGTLGTGTGGSQPAQRVPGTWPASLPSPCHHNYIYYVLYVLFLHVFITIIRIIFLITYFLSPSFCSNY